ncbi:MAG: 16S rRNA (cytosine(1402)-N(4))-methyltransferase RsmH [Candidatus Gastranaerophilales bacterium]|nr:16S rRNA (cytosine(1402)-N(4))-methyltransferase RsmH [Candidatus Gastranaerophilales bacterium]
MENFESEKPNFVHYTVMKQEVVDSLNCYDSDKIFVDCTLGGGGHSEEILKRISSNGRLISFDVDDDAINHASERLKEYKNLTIIKGSYADIDIHLKNLGIEKITGGIIFDLGASYHQLTCANRGFSFMKDAPLDMRFNQQQDWCAWDVVNKYKEAELVEIFSNYGEERFSKRIARAIVQNRPINSTLELAQLIKNSTPNIKSKIHPATRVFQALRIEVNQELLNFENTLKKVIELTDVNAIISLLSFHSLEDRLAKRFLKSYSSECRCDKNIIKCACGGKLLELVNKKPIMASCEELKINPPSRSAKLRIARKIK